ncbi:MAG: ATPase domain-containing protein [Candidatus Woesearchaeota archaeon]
MDKIYSIELEGDELHLKLGGGIPKNSLVLIEGPAGLGKSILAQRFVYGAIKNNVSISYVSSELSVQSFLSQMDSLKYDIRKEFLAGQLKFITTFPLLGRVNFEPDMIKKIFLSKKLLESEVIVIDALNDFVLKNESNLSETFEFISAFKKLTSSGKTVIFCVEPEIINREILKYLQNTVEVHLVMFEREQYGNILNILQVKRFLGAINDVERELPFKVRAGIGIVVDLSG